jgi:thioredoxin reductase (NADPH)
MANEYGVLSSRFDQMFPVLSAAEIDRVRKFGDVKRFAPGEMLSRTGTPTPGMYVLLSGRVAVSGRDAVGRSMDPVEFARMVGARVEDIEVVPGEVLADLSHISGQPAPSHIDSYAVGEVEVIMVPPDRVRALLVADAELGERILRALMLRHVLLIELGFGGPVVIGSLRMPEVTKLCAFLGRNASPFRLIDPDEDADAAALVARYASSPDDLPIIVMPDGAILKRPNKQQLADSLGLVARTLRSEPYDVVIVGAGPAGLAAAVYAASEGLAVLVLEALTFGGQAGASARIENYLGFPTGISGQALMGRAFTQAQKFGVDFSLATRVQKVDCTSEWTGNDPAHVIELEDGRRVRARAVVVATGAKYRRPELAGLAAFEGRGISYWASPVEARLCRDEEVVLLGGGNSAGQAAVFLSSHARRVKMLVRGKSLSITMSRYLVDRIAACTNVDVLVETEVVQLVGTPERGLERVRWRHRTTNREEERAISHMFVFTGADPATTWLDSCGVALDDRGFVRTGAQAALPLQTTIEGIFAIGDVRAESTKRVGAAIGEGAAVVAQLHVFLSRRSR